MVPTKTSEVARPRGVNGVCIIAHGGSSALAMKNAIRMGADALKQEVNPHIIEALAACGMGK